MKLLDDASDGLDDRIDLPVMERTTDTSVRHLTERHHVVRPRAEIADHDPIALHAERHLRLIAIAERRRQTNGSVYRAIQACFTHAILDHALFDRPVRGINNVLHFTTAATVKNRARRFDALGGRMQKFDYARNGEVLLDFLDLHADDLAHERERNEQHESVVPRNAFAVHAGFGNGKFENIANLHHTDSIAQSARIDKSRARIGKN